MVQRGRMITRSGACTCTCNFLRVSMLIVSFFLPLKGYIKGYVHHRRQIAVVSKMNAFPKISNVHLTTEIYDEELEREHLALMEEQDAMAMG